METEKVIFGAGMIGCAQLEAEGVDVIDNAVLVEFEVSPQDLPIANQLVVGLKGLCITGRSGECPRSHNCGGVKITMSAVPIYVEIEPIAVEI